MENHSKIDVKIFGQTYTVTGGDSADYVLKVSRYVDDKMSEISNALNSNTLSEISVLTALNIADDYFKSVAGRQSDLDANRRVKDDMENYQKLWEEAKSSFAQLKQEANETTERLKQELQEMTEKLAEEEAASEAKSQEIIQLKDQLDEVRADSISLQNNIDEMKERLTRNESNQKDSSEEMKELMEKTKELETSFFDIQMENIQLKSEIEKYKKNTIEW